MPTPAPTVGPARQCLTAAGFAAALNSIFNTLGAAPIIGLPDDLNNLQRSIFGCLHSLASLAVLFTEGRLRGEVVPRRFLPLAREAEALLLDMRDRELSLREARAVAPLPPRVDPSEPPGSSATMALALAADRIVNVVKGAAKGLAYAIFDDRVTEEGEEAEMPSVDVALTWDATAEDLQKQFKAFAFPAPARLFAELREELMALARTPTGAKAGQDDDGQGQEQGPMCSAKDIAERYKVEQKALEQRLRRWRMKNMALSGTDFIEVTDRRAQGVRYLYRVPAVESLIRP